MPIDLNAIIEHEMSEECPACRAQQLVEIALLPAASAWEAAHELPRFSMALHGAAGLLSTLRAEGVPRDQLDAALARLLDEFEQQIAEDKAMGGPTQGTA
jgi:hypothetical protein